jgi:hypothetical protein
MLGWCARMSPEAEVRAFRVDFSKAKDIRTFARLYQMTHSDFVVIQPKANVPKIPNKVRECLIEIPAGPFIRQKQAKDSGLILPKG